MDGAIITQTDMSRCDLQPMETPSSSCFISRREVDLTDINEKNKQSYQQSHHAPVATSPVIASGINRNHESDSLEPLTAGKSANTDSGEAGCFIVIAFIVAALVFGGWLCRLLNIDVFFDEHTKLGVFGTLIGLFLASINWLMLLVGLILIGCLDFSKRTSNFQRYTQFAIGFILFSFSLASLLRACERQ
jgi:hypothetical protein